MATTMQLSDLMTAVRQRADMLPLGYSPSLSSTSYFVTDPELISYINQSYFELYDLLISAYGNDYFVAEPVSFQTDGINAKFSLPDGALFSGAPSFYKLLGVDLLVMGSTNQWTKLKEFAFSERNRFSPYGLQALYSYSNLRYRLAGNKIWFTPLPQSGLTIQLWYIPRLTPLAALTDTMDGISGWTEYVIIDAAIKCSQKEESDISAFMTEKQAITRRIEAMAENRDAGTSSCSADSRGTCAGELGIYGDPFGGL